MPLPHCVYVLLSLTDGHFYIGYTTDLDRRLREHTEGRSKSTAPRRPLKLVFSEFYLAEQDARRREKYLKTSAGRRALRLMLPRTLTDVVRTTESRS